MNFDIPLAFGANKHPTFAEIGDSPNFYGYYFFRGNSFFLNSMKRYVVSEAIPNRLHVCLRWIYNDVVGRSEIPNDIPHFIVNGHGNDWKILDIRQPEAIAWLKRKINEIKEDYKEVIERVQEYGIFIIELSGRGILNESNLIPNEIQADIYGIDLVNIQIDAWKSSRVKHLVCMGEGEVVCEYAIDNKGCGGFQDNSGTETYDSMWKGKGEPDCVWNEVSGGGIAFSRTKWSSLGIPFSRIRDFFRGNMRTTVFYNMAEGSAMFRDTTVRSIWDTVVPTAIPRIREQMRRWTNSNGSIPMTKITCDLLSKIFIASDQANASWTYIGVEYEADQGELISLWCPEESSGVPFAGWEVNGVLRNDFNKPFPTSKPQQIMFIVGNEITEDSHFVAKYEEQPEPPPEEDEALIMAKENRKAIKRLEEWLGPPDLWEE